MISTFLKRTNDGVTVWAIAHYGVNAVYVDIVQTFDNDFENRKKFVFPHDFCPELTKENLLKMYEGIK